MFKEFQEGCMKHTDEDRGFRREISPMDVLVKIFEKGRGL
jgi:hypothetical protein